MSVAERSSIQRVASRLPHKLDDSVRVKRLPVTVLLLIGMAWRLIGLTEQSFWRDEVDVIRLAIRPLDDILSMFTSPAQNGPLYFLLLRPWIRLFGGSEFSLRITSVLASVIAIALLWQVARRLLPGDKRDGIANLPLLASLFMVFNPYQIWYGQEAKMYALVMVLTLLSTWLWIRAMERGGWADWLLYVLLTSLSIYTHLLTALILPLHFLWFLIAHPLNRQRWKGYLAALSGFVLPYIPLVWWQWHYLTSIDYDSGYSFTPFEEVVRVLLLDHTRGALTSVSHLWIVPILFLVLAGVVLGAGELGYVQPGSSSPNRLLFALRPEIRLAMVILWLVGPVLLIHAVSLIKPIFVDRYVIWIGSALMLLMALGTRAIQRSSRRWGNGVALGLVALVLGFWIYAGWEQVHRPNKTQLREAIGFVSERRTDYQLLILQIPYTEHAYRYYTSDFGPDPFSNSDDRLVPWVEGLWTRNDLSDEEARARVASEMEANVEGFDEAWLVLVEAGSWDPRRLMEQWLDGEAELVERREFHGIEARRYRFSND